MGALTRDYDWASSPVGPPETWPISLCTTVSMILSARSPMFLWWGTDLIQFYNDAYRPSLGNDGKHPRALGQRGEACWPEIWPVIKPLIDQVMTGGGATYSENQLIPIYRNGSLEDVYWTFSYNPVRDDNFKIAGVLVVCQETTNEVIGRKNLELNESRFRSIVEQAPMAIGLLSGPEMIVELGNDKIFQVWGKDKSVTGLPVIEALPEIKGQVFPQLLQDVYNTGQPFYGNDILTKLVQNEKLVDVYLDFTYTPLLDVSGAVKSIMVLATDVTQKINAMKALEQNEAKLRSVIEAAPTAMGLFVGRDLIIEMPNQAFIDIVGKGPDIAGKPLRQVMPELEDQPFLQILDDVYTTGQMYQAFSSQVNVMRAGVMTTDYYNITYAPILDNNGKVYAILEIASNVTERTVALRQIEESQTQLLTLFEQSPVAIATISRQDLIFTMANPFYAELVGRTPEELVGKPLVDALPELAAQGFDQLISNVISTGVPFLSKEQAINVVRDGAMQAIYVDLTCQPKRDAEGNVNGVLLVATDMTQQVKSRKEIEQAEITLRGAVELAELGTWEIDLHAGILQYSDRLRMWLGAGPDEIITVERAYRDIRAEDRPRVKAAIQHALTPGTNGIYDIEYFVDVSQAGQERILHAQGKTYYDDKGKPYKITGTVQDVTEQRAVRLALEHQVQRRTEELESANEELAASNEELATINEEFISINDELSRSNNLLARSNENLQQFAYVASHDLLEPLRKVQSFGDLLMKRYASQLGDGKDYVLRMQAAAQRMSTLIEDLLTFSRVSASQDVHVLVSLDKVVDSALGLLDYAIHESGAEVTVEKLPAINGHQLQLEQLFLNLLSNAIKFRKAGTTPLISITCEQIGAKKIPYPVKPARSSPTYYRIDVTDNGIGFASDKVDRIFQVFQRLHGKNEYAGTGIGLAICEKVALNHGGAITATSEPGKGSTFSLFLPG